MKESQELIKRKIDGRQFDLESTNRINVKISSEKTEIMKKHDERTKKIPYEKMNKKDLEEYKQDLAVRLMLFDSETTEIRKQIENISKIQNREKST